MRKSIIIVSVAVFAAITAGCGRSASPAGAGQGEPQTVEIALEEYKFVPDAISVRPGEKVRFVLTNRGKEDHEFEGEAIGIEEIVVPPGKRREMSWTAPAKTGTYDVVCDLPGHLEKGMILKVTVKE